MTLTPLPPVRPSGFTTTCIPRDLNRPTAASTSSALRTTTLNGAISGQALSTRPIEYILSHSMREAALVAPAVRMPAPRSASTTPLASGWSALTNAKSTECLFAKPTTASGSPASPTVWAPPDLATLSAMPGFSWPTTAYTRASTASRAANAASLPPLPQIRIFSTMPEASRRPAVYQFDPAATCCGPAFLPPPPRAGGGAFSCAPMPVRRRPAGTPRPGRPCLHLPAPACIPCACAHTRRVAAPARGAAGRAKQLYAAQFFAPQWRAWSGS